MIIEGRQTDIAQESLHATPYLFAFNSSNSDQRFLDVGVGDGTPLNRALKWANTRPELIIGVDINPTLLTDLPNGTNIVPVTANGLALPFKDGGFSLVTAFQVIEHINPEEHQRFLEELMRVAQSKGRIAIATMNKDFPYNVRGHKSHVAEFNKAKARSFVELCKQHGNAELFAVVPSQRYIEAQAKRAKFWMFRPIKDRVPRAISELALTLLTRGKVHLDLDMKGDFQIQEFNCLDPQELFTDFLILMTKS